MSPNNSSKIEMTGLDDINDKRVRVILYSGAEIKNFIYSIEQNAQQINAIDTNYHARRPHVLKNDGSVSKQFYVAPPNGYSDTISKYVTYSTFALLNGQLYVFGGSSDHYKVIKDKKNAANAILLDFPFGGMRIHGTVSSTSRRLLLRTRESFY